MKTFLGIILKYVIIAVSYLILSIPLYFGWKWFMVTSLNAPELVYSQVFLLVAIWKGLSRSFTIANVELEIEDLLIGEVFITFVSTIEMMFIFGLFKLILLL